MTDDKPNLELIREAAEAAKQEIPSEILKECDLAAEVDWYYRRAAVFANTWPEVVKAFKEYAGHKPDCDLWEQRAETFGIKGVRFGGKCTCGRDDTLAALRGESG